jgi:perosamine synthetase
MQAALGVAQIGRMDQIVAKKRWIAGEYARRFQDFSGLQLPAEESWARSVYWMYGIVLSEDVGQDAAGFSRKMADRGIETRPFFLGMHEQPVFKRRKLFTGERYPVAERLAKQGLYLPSGLSLTEEQIGYVADAVRAILGAGPG